MSAFVFSDTWTETSTADFAAGLPTDTQTINDSVSISAQSAWWDPRADWWDTNWLYRKSITVNNQNSSALSDYQVKITNPVHDETGLVGSWHFSEALSDVSLAARDSSGLGNIGFFGGSDNLAPNPDFETGSPGSWSWAWGNAGTSSSWDSVAKYSGSYSLKQTHTVTTDSSVWYADTAFGTITPGRIYTVSAWIKTNGTGVGGARFWIGWDDADGIRLADKSNPGYYTTNNAWQYITFTLDGSNVPPANTSRARIHLQHFSFLGDIWFDNVRLTSRYPTRTASGKNGNGVSFDGIDDSIEVLDNTISGTAVDACDAAAGWVKQGAGGSIVLNNSIYREGTGSLELLKSGATGTDSYFEKSIAATNMQGKLLNLWLYVRDAAAMSKINRVELYLIAPAYSNYINKTPILPSTLKIGWNLLTFDTSFPTGTAGTPDLTNVQILRIDVDTNNAADLFGAGEIIMDNWFLTSGQPTTPSLRFGLNSAMTIESWIYPTDPAVVWRCFFQKGGISDNDANYVFRQYGLNIQFFYRGINSLWHYVGTLSDPLTINAWNQVAISFIYGKPETMKLFVNGNSIPFVWIQGNGTITPTQNSDPVVFGGKNAWNQPFAGSMDETRLYNRALSSDEIKAHYDAKVKPAYDDMRFVKPDGTELPFWCEQDGTFWVKVSGTNSIPQGISNIYAYYGNPSAASASNGTNTFALFDKFDSMSQWFTSYQLAMLDTTYTYEGAYNARVKNDVQVETKIVISTDPLVYEIKMYDDYFPKIACTSLPTIGTAYILGFNKNLINNNYVYRVGGTWYDSGIVRTRAWHNLKQAWDGTNVAMYIDNTRVYGPAPTTDGVPLNYVFADYWLQSKSETCFDSFRARKYAALEPITTAGSETGQSTQWPYRKAISVSNPSSSLSDYQLTVKPFSLQRYEETDPACSFTGTWGIGSAVNHSNGAVKRSLIPGDYAVFTFSGTGVMWIGNKTTNRGIANVYIDDIFQYAVDCYEPLGLFQLALFTKTGLTDAVHTLKVEVSNAKNPASTDYYISIDAFEVYTATNNDFINNNGIAGSWHFSQGSGNFAADSSGNNNDCVFCNQALRTIYTMTSSADSYAYIDLTGVTDYTIQAGDYLEYDLYWTSNSDYIAFDYTCSDATTLRGAGALDQNGMNANPATNLSSQAQNKWYHRKIALPGGHTGKLIQKYDAACEDNNSATRTAFFGNILITNGAGTIRKTIYAGGTPAYANDFVSNGVLSYITTNDSAAMPGWANGKFGNGISFNGLLNYAEAADSASLDITHAITLEAWLKPSSYFSAVNNYVITKGLDSYVLSCTDAGAVSMSVYADGTLRTVAGGSVPLSQWSHITGTYDSSTKQLRVYVNGIFQNSLTLSGLTSYRINTNTSNLRIGFYEPGKGVNGVLDEVRVYSRALTDDEILAKYSLHQSKLNADYSDIRFTGNSGTEFPCWMETDRTFWVRMTGRDAVPYGDSTLYMYYGNMTAKDASNGNMTFDFFDDFNDSNFNTQWTNPSGTFTEANGYVQQTSDTGAAANEGTDELRSIAQIPASMAAGGFTAQASIYSGNSGSWNDIAGVIFTAQTSTSLRYGNSSTDRLSLFNRYNSGADNGFGVDYKTGWIYTVGDSYLSGWNRISAVFKGADGWDLKGYDINDTIMGAGNGLNETVRTGPLYIRLHSYNNSTRWDNVFIHKYAAIEPSVSSTGTEETPYLSTGAFTSAVKDTAANDSIINSTAWSVSGTGTITMQIRANNSPLGWTGSSPAWENVSNGDTSITSKGRYLQYKATFTGNGSSSNPALTDITVTYTAPVTPPADSVSCDKLSNTWYSTATFTFTNNTGFGAQIDKYYYAWDTASSHAFTLTEPVWNSSTPPATAPQLLNSSTSDGLWYFHYLPISSTNTTGAAQDIGPYKYDGTSPTACVPLSPANN
ncbi:MAG: DUF2341 domain-containing protein, partial [Planctomycetes bacterium]|nr:DUF2341 domain-containing protein [Planctomycetota bacterium]